jgi:hypothetical protein
MPISDILETEGTAPEIAPRPSTGPVSAPAVVEARADAATMLEDADAADGLFAPPVTLPAPRYWAWAMAGVATGALLALV